MPKKKQSKPIPKRKAGQPSEEPQSGLSVSQKKLIIKDLLQANYNYRVVIVLLLALLVVIYLNTPVGVEHISVMHQNAFEIQQLVKQNWEKANITIPYWDDPTVVRFLDIASFYNMKNKLWDKQDPEPLSPEIYSQLQNFSKNYPLVLVPGFVTSKLELWKGQECAKDYFQSSIWGGLSMLELILKDIECWATHMSLDLESGLDLDGVKLRAADSAHSIDYLFPGYWVWAKLIQYLAALGYDSNDLLLASYDWRLSPQLMESRDRYFSKLKMSIENMVTLNNKKVVAISHSMGSNVWVYFMKWVEFRDPLWVDKHVHAFVNIGGAILGSMKGLSTLLSGEMKDSVEMEIPRAYVADRLLSPLKRLRVFRSWSAVASLLPKGGNSLWGEEGGLSPDGTSPYTLSISMEESIDFLFERLQDKELDYSSVAKNLQKWYSFDTKVQQLNETKDDSKYWTNPLQSPLPYAPEMKIFCLYGVNKPTERGFHYKDQALAVEAGERVHVLEGLKYSIDTNQENNGIKLGDGDGTVPLISLGYMCVDGWKWDRYNPSKSPVITREYQHNPTSMVVDVRGGRDTADHVDIMGNVELLQDVMRIVSGSDAYENRIFSGIEEISTRIRENIKKRDH